ncbi:methyl-accepting chemotaxis protein [Anoxybacillus flavithermus AK1]|uniref:Methyl-accepting chemotaxis protein n=2 Tax=Anoxybacillus flavithermus TaxID=33934 RepID=M8E0T5_9BACL|nr:globin-coupled sensor protein [Anoxybacillus flavithermus]EMT46579.1 methyl-accepting chemotaxis protein [Anoxybacillus flavithermus AK1]
MKIGGNAMSKCPFHALFNERGAIQLFRKKHQQEKENTTSRSSTTAHVATYYRQLASSDRKQQIAFVQLTEEDVQQLASIRPLFAKHVERIVDAFYDQVGQMPHLRKIIDHHSTIDRLKQTLRAYLMDMVSGEIGDQYVIRRKVIGNVHNRIGLFPEWYLGAYAIIQNEVLHILMEELPPTEATAVYRSFNKLCSFDMQIAIETYIESYTSSMMKLNEISELQHRLTESSTTLASSAEETTASIFEVQKNVQSMLNEVTSIQRQSVQMTERVEKGKEDVKKTLTKLDGVARLIEGTKSLTNELTDSSRKIGEIVNAIRSISNQTNILSLNANIEAARAGEHGKGFAVVANEVRKLASQTEQSLDYIQNHIDVVQQTIRKFEHAFQQIVEETRAFRQANESIIHIFDQSVTDVKITNKKIDQFTSLIEQFHQMFDEISSAASQIAEMAEQLNDLNQELTDKFNS